MFGLEAFKENIKFNQKEILERKIVLLSKPRKLNVALTTRCNISCVMCEVKKNAWEIPGRTIKELASFFPYLERIIWQGGEVFLFDSFKEMLQEASRYPNITHEITTNSHLIDEGWIEVIKKINLDLNISVDGFSESVYEYVRRGSKFSNLLRALNLINEARKGNTRKELVLIFTVIKSNFKELDKIVDFARRHHFNRIIIQPVKGNHQNEENIFYHKDTAALEYIEGIKGKLKKEAKDAGIDLVEWLPTNFCPKDERSIHTKDEKDPDAAGLFCYAPWQQLFVEWGGKVYPHCLCLEDGLNDSRVIGSVLENSLTEIWNGERMQAFRKKIIDNQVQSICCYDCVSGLVSGNLRNLSLGPADANRSESGDCDLDLLFQRGKSYINENNLELALKEFQEILVRAPDNAEAHFELGKVHYLKGSYPLAVKEVLDAQRLNPGSRDSRLLLAKLYKTIGKYESAFEAIEPLLGGHLPDPQIAKELGDIYPGCLRELKDYNNQGEFSRVLEIAPRLYETIPEDDVFYRNKALGELEIAQKKLVVNSKMRNLIVTLSTACNLKCVMCEARALNWKIPKNILEEVISCFPYLERLVWQGGEAFLVDYFDELIEKAAKFPHLRQVITTNGLLIDQRRSENLVRANVDLTFSIDGVTKEVYEKVRQGASFDLLMRNLNNFNRIRRIRNNPLLNTNLHAVIMRSNYRQLEAYIDFAREHEFKLIAFLPIGGNFDNPENIFHSRDREALDFIEKAIPGIEEKAQRYGILLENRLPVKKTPVTIKTGRGAGPVSNPNFENRLLCHLPWIQLYIDFDGGIRPDCVCRPDKSIGHADRDSLAQVWNNAKMQEYRKIIADNCCSRICNMECVAGQVSERYLKFS